MHDLGSNNPSLTNISGINQCTSIGAQFTVFNNNSLTNISGFNGVNFIAGYLNISSNLSLTTISMLNGLNYIDGSLSIYSNANLISLAGFSAITLINGDFHFSNNSSWTTLSAFGNLSEIVGSIEIYSNPDLTSLQSLMSLSSIEGEIIINANDALSSLSGLDNIDPSTITNLQIVNSDILSICGVQSICDYLDIPSNSATIGANTMGCNSRLEVEMSCVNCFPVSIVQQPQDQSVPVGSNATFNVKISGTPPFTYQWYLNGVAISGATEDTYITPVLTLADNGNTYYCFVTNCNGDYEITSDIATLTVTDNCIPIAIAFQPQNQTVAVGGTATFGVLVSGSSPFVFNWYKNGVLIPGANGQTYTTPPVTMLDNGSTFFCVISNCNGLFAVTSNSALLTVIPACIPVEITTQPQNQTANVGSTATFNVVVSGSSPFIYKWYKNGILIQGSNSPTYTTPILTIADNGNTYYCKITNCNNGNQVISNTVMLTVIAQCVPVSITTQPNNQTASVGSTATFSVAVNGTAPFLYFWYKNNVLIPGASSATYTTPPLTLADNGNIYKCIITNCNSSNQAISNSSHLTVTNSCSSVSILDHPDNQSAPVGATAAFFVEVDGTSPFLYFWYKNNVLIPGASSYTYTTPTLTQADNGNVYKCIITNCNSTYQAISNNAILTVTTPCAVSILSNPTNQSVTAPNSAYFNVSVTGSSPFVYQWQVSTNSGSTWSNLTNSGNSTWTNNGASSTLTILNTTGLNNRRYRCVVANNCPSSVTSNAAILTVGSGCVAISISSQPSSQSQSPPSSASFTVAVVGNSPSYVWQYQSPGGSWGNLNNLGNTTWTTVGTTSTLTVHNVTGLNNYKYRSVISNACPSYATSNAATLTVNTVTYWIGGYTQPKNNPNFPNEKLLVTATTNSPAAKPLKVCADGSNATIIKLNCDNPNLNMTLIRFRLSSDPNSINQNLYGGFNNSEYYSTSNLSQTRLTHPNYLPHPNHFRRDTILAYNINNPTIILIKLPIIVYRAPILFVHGLWGKYSSFAELDTYFKDYFLSSEITTYRADYSAHHGAAKSFSYNTSIGVIPNNIFYTLNKAINSDFSTGKVDLICHSMGGVLARLHMQSSSYLFNIHTLTTINTPHSGTQAANFLLSHFVPDWIKELMKSINNCVDCGAVLDLRFNSSAYQNNLNGNLRKVPSLIYTSDSYFSLAQDGFAMNLIWSFNIDEFNSIGLSNPLLMNQSLYNPDISDIIVPLESQKGGASNVYNHFNQTAHTKSKSNSSLFPQLLSRLGQNPKSSFFNQNGFQPANLQLPWWLNSNISIPLSLPVVDTIKIDSPINGSIYNKGDVVNIDISDQNGQFDYIGYSIVYQGLLLDANSTSDSVLNTEFVIPADAYGNVKILAYGYSNSGSFDFDSTTFFVNITAELESIQIQSDTLLLPIGSYQNLNVDGYYSDSIIRNISTLPGISYEILDTSIVSFSEINTLFAKQYGTTKILVRFLGFSDSTYATVYHSPLEQTANFSFDHNVLCAYDTIHLIDQSSGSPISWEWIFPGGFPATSTSQNPVITYSTPGTYGVTFIAKWQNNQDTIYLDSFITVNTLPIPSISGLDSICQGDAAILDAGTDYKIYQWSTMDTTSTIIAEVAGNYLVSVVDSNGCHGTSSPFLLSVDNGPFINLGPDSIQVSSSTLLDAGPNGISYLWSTGDTSQTILVSTPGNYSVLVLDTNGCRTMDSIFVDISTKVIRLNDAEKLEIYPNPNNGSFKLRVVLTKTELFTVKMVNALGQVVFFSDPELVGGDYTKVINLDKIIDGIYYIQIDIGNSKYNGRVIIIN